MAVSPLSGATRALEFAQACVPQEERLLWLPNDRRNLVLDTKGTSTCRLGMTASEMIEADLDFLATTTLSVSSSLLEKEQILLPLNGYAAPTPRADLHRQRSSVPCSTHIAESAVIPASAEMVWSHLRKMDFAHNHLVTGVDTHTSAGVMFAQAPG